MVQYTLFSVYFYSFIAVIFLERNSEVVSLAFLQGDYIETPPILRWPLFRLLHTISAPFKER